ncbi:MAG: hypothetical protein J4F46_02965 [Dehalococcoidia bacterium]|nr:hypothetical protein [Dehalococcoidia bacterium]
MKKLTFVSLEPRNAGFTAFVPMENLASVDDDPELLLRAVSTTYARYIGLMRSLKADTDNLRKKHIPIPARKVWELGDIIFDLRRELSQQAFELDGLYDHLVRDLGVKRKWLEKVIIFRRYLPRKAIIPESLPWGRCEKSTRKVAESLREAYIVDSET